MFNLAEAVKVRCEADGDTVAIYVEEAWTAIRQKVKKNKNEQQLEGVAQSVEQRTFNP